MFIYSLNDSDGNVFYIGRSKDPYVGMLNHVSKCYLLKTKKDEIINEMCKKYVLPKINILEEIDVDLNNKKSIFNVSDRESYWISTFPDLKIQKRIKLKTQELTDRCPFCIYCGERMQIGTAKKKFCSDKCRVYFNREHPKGNTVSPLELASKREDVPNKVQLAQKERKVSEMEPKEGSLAWFIKNS